MIEKVPLNENELKSIRCGEAVTLAAVMAILVISIVAVVVYKLYTSNAGTTTLPGGYKFEWK